MGDDPVADALTDHEFEVLDSDFRVEVTEEGDQVGVDYRLARDGQTFMALVRRAANPETFLESGLPRAFMLLEAVCRRGPKYDDDNYAKDQPLIIVETDWFDLKMYGRMGKHMTKYAPAYEAVILLDQEDGTRELVIDTQREKGYLPEGEFEPESPDIPFGDLDLWLTKILLYADDPEPEWPLEGSIENANQLAEVAGVSIDKAYKFSRALKEDGHLTDEEGQFELTKPDDWIELWKWYYDFQKNDRIGFYKVPTDGDDLLDRVRVWIGDLNPEVRRQFVLTGTLAGEAVDPFTTVHPPGDLYYLGSEEHLTRFDLLLVEDEEIADIRVWKPKFRKAVEQGALEWEGIRIADRLQRRLDASSEESDKEDAS